MFVCLVECGLVFGSERVSEERKSGGFRVEKERERERGEKRRRNIQKERRKEKALNNI